VEHPGVLGAAPCEELTTREPFLSATRVSPPGVTVTFSPYRMYGRRST